MLRDPRDRWLSVAQFDKQRGFYGFQRSPDESEEDYLENFIEVTRETLVAAAGICESEQDIVVRYEDLILHADEQTKRLEDWLGIRLNLRQALGKSRAYRDHMTSETAETSVYRWHREMPRKLNEYFVSRLGPELEAVGYSTQLAPCRVA